MDVANELCDKGALDEAECFIDATFVMAKGGGAEIGPTKRGKGMKIMAIVDRHGLPLSVSTHSPLHATLARRALLRLDSMAAPDPHSLGVPRPQFPRLCPACLPRYSLQTILRRVLITEKIMEPNTIGFGSSELGTNHARIA